MNYRLTLGLIFTLPVWACADLGETEAPGAEAGAAISELTTDAPLELRAAHSNLCLGISGASKNNGAALVQQACVGSASQRFKLVRSGEFFTVINEHSGRCLDVAQASKERGAVVMQHRCHGGENQQWRITEPQSKVLRFVARHSGLALDIAGASRTSGTAAIQWASSETAGNQRFRVSLAGPSTPKTPVARHGKLRVSGSRIVGEDGQPVQLRGVSSMWLNWENEGYAEDRRALEWMRDNWKVGVIRAAMGVSAGYGAQDWGYERNPERALRQVDTIVQNAIDLGVYVIVDWHEHSAHEKPELAAAFFDRMAKRWGQYPNVIWETFNEPVGVTWGGGLKRYHERIVDTIRRTDSDNLVTLGTPNWSQEVDAAAADPLTGAGRSNLLYTLHFYACSHRINGYVGTRAQRAIAAGLPLFVSEWGATHADGGTAANPGVCAREADEWHALLDRNGIWSAAWKLDGCADSSCLLRSGAPRSGAWDGWLQGHGSYVVSVLKR